MTFEEIKQELVKRTKNVHSCVDGLTLLLKSNTYQDILNTAKFDFVWTITKGILTAKDLEEWFDPDLLIQNNIYISGEHNVSKGTTAYFLGSSIGNVYDTSRVYAFDNSIINAYDNSFVCAYDNVEVNRLNDKVLVNYTYNGNIYTEADFNSTTKEIFSN